MFILLEIALIAVVLVLFLSMLAKSGILKSQKNKLEKAARDLNEQTRDPIADAEAAICDAQESVTQLKAIRIEERTRLAKFKKLRETNSSNVVKWDDLAKAAGQAQNADDVRKCLTHKSVYQKQKEELDISITSAETSIANLSSKITALESKIADAGEHKQTLTLRKEKADVDAEIARRAKEIDIDALDGAFAQLEADTLNAEARTEAMLSEEQASAPAADTLADKYLAKKPAISDEDVSAYMKQS